MLGLGDRLDPRKGLESEVLVGGATGTLLFDRGVERPQNDANLIHAKVVRDLHEEYTRAGARVVGTNDYVTNRVRPETRDPGDKARRINAAGARLVREAVDGYGVEVARKLLAGAKLRVGRT